MRFVTTQKGHVIIVLIYRKPLDDNWTQAAEEAVPLLLKGRARGCSSKDRGQIQEDEKSFQLYLMPRMKRRRQWRKST